MNGTKNTTVTLQEAHQQLLIASKLEDELLELLLILHSLKQQHHSSLSNETLESIVKWLYKFQDVLENNTTETKRRYTSLRNL